MRAIHKFDLPKRGNVKLSVPKGTEFMQALPQRETEIVLYGLVDLDTNGVELRDIHVFVTGFSELPPINDGVDEYRYLGTAMLFRGEYVAHVFERFDLPPAEETALQNGQKKPVPNS